MAQFARPNSDVSTSDWTATPLWEKLDETSASDADFISSNVSSNSTVEVGLSDITDPTSSTGHVVRYRYAKSASGGNTRNLTVRLVQGSTIIATQSHLDITEAWTAGSFTLTGAEADAITDYADLRVRLTSAGVVSGSAGVRRAVQVSWVEVEAPDATPVSVTGALAGSLPAVAGTLTGAATSGGELTGALPLATGILTGTAGDPDNLGELAAVLLSPIGSFTGTPSASGETAGVLPTPAGVLSGTAITSGAMAGALPPPAGALSGASVAAGSLGGELPVLTGSATGAGAAVGALTGTLPLPTGVLSSSEAEPVTGGVSGVLPSPVMALTGVMSVGGEFVVAPLVPALTLVGVCAVVGVLDGRLPLPIDQFTDRAPVVEPLRAGVPVAESKLRSGAPTSDTPRARPSASPVARAGTPVAPVARAGTPMSSEFVVR